MKRLNNKAFTLIELLAVIVILALIVAIAIPGVTRYLQSARKGVYYTNAATAINAVKDDVNFNGVSSDKVYTIEDVNTLLDTKLKESPFGVEYLENSYVKVTFDSNGYPTYSICLLDIQGNGFYDATTKAVAFEDLSDDNVKTGLAGVSCE